jgi:hypothetical protein
MCLTWCQLCDQGLPQLLQLRHPVSWRPLVLAMGCAVLLLTSSLNAELRS